MGKYIIGIDLGTTNSAVSIYENDQAKILENSLGKRTTPSVVAFKKSKNKKTGEVTTELMVGESAKRQAITNPLNTLHGVKRLIGRRIDDPAVLKMKELSPFKIVEGRDENGIPNGDAWVEIDGKAMAPAQISAEILRALKTAVEKYLGEEVTDAVITVPAYFNDSQRQATKNAGKIAGLNVKRIVNEPTAAALAYGMDKKTGGKIIVYDLGGGTFDVSVLDVAIDEKDGSLIQVLSTNGDTFLGGENFDERIIDHLVEVLMTETGLDLKTNKDVQALQRLKEAAEKAKIELSLQEMTDINLPFIGRDDNGDTVNFEYALTRQKLEQLVLDLINKTIDPCKKALADAKLKITDIDEIILVGGQTRMPKVIETVRSFFGKEPRQDVNPDEIVAMGASIQGAIIDGKVENVLLLDVIPLSIGIKTAGDVMFTMIPRNSTIPTEAKEVFSTSEDRQPNVRIEVFQGERAKATENKSLGEFKLDLPPLPKGKPQIEITFSIDADGVLTVQAKDIVSNQAKKLTVKANGGLSDAEVDRMLKDAEANAEADRLFKERQMASIHAEQELKDAAGDTAQEYFQKAPADLQQTFHENVKELTEAIAKKDVTVMLDRTKKLQEVRSAIGEAFYNAAQAENTAAAPAPEEPLKPSTAVKDPPSPPL